MKTFLLLTTILICTIAVNAQVANFTFDQQVGSYSEISGGTVIAIASGTTTTSRLQNINYPSQSIPFTFTFSGSPYTEFNINSNGFITFGATLPSAGTTSSAISGNTGYEGAIVPFNAPMWGAYGGECNFTNGSNVLTGVSNFAGVVIGKDIQSFFGDYLPANTTVTGFDEMAGTITVSNSAIASISESGFFVASGEIRTQTLGSTPNRIHVIQWKNFARSGGTSNTFGTLVNVQIRLHETTNKIEYVYGLCAGVVFNWSPRVGMRGVNNADYQTRRNNGSLTWLTSESGNSNNWDMSFTASKLPDNGLTYTWEQPSLPANDVGVFAALPNSGVQIMTPGDITATVRNFGASSQSNVEVFYRYSSDGGMTFSSPVGPVIAPGPINTNQNEDVVFTGANAFNPPVHGNYIVKIYTSHAGDLDNSNDTLMRSYMAGKVDTYPYFVDFENINGWTRSGQSILWFHSVGFGPTGALSANYLCFFWGISDPTPGLLRTPIMDFTGLTNPMMSFYVAYRSFSGENDRLRIAVSTNGGTSFEFGTPDYYNKARNTVPSLATKPDSAGYFDPSIPTDWRHEIVDLSDYAGMSNVMVAFYGVSAWGNNAHLDLMKVFDASNTSIISVNAPGVYGSLMTDRLQVNFSSLRPHGNINQNNSTYRTTQKEIYDASNDVVVNAIEDDRETLDKKIQKPTSRTSQTFTDDPEASSGVLTIARTNGFPENNSYQTNTTATTQSGAIFTPDVVSNVFWDLAYSGDDYISIATYDLIIDISTQIGIADADRLYIMKRVDMNSPWVCLPTSTEYEMGLPVRLVATGLQRFSQFAIGTDDGTLPVDLISFTSTVSNRDVNLKWTTAWEENNMRFDVQRKPVTSANVILSASEESQTWITIGSVAGSGTVYEERHYSYVDKNLVTGKYEYRLVQIDFDRNSTADHTLLNTVEIGVPETFALSQNYPNPFNPVTKIGYEIPVESFVKLSVFDVTGREVATLVNENVTPGFYTAEFNASNFGSGVYFYRLNAGNAVITKKMLMLK